VEFPQPILTDTKIRPAKTTEKPTKLTDEGGLFLLLAPSGGRWWRFKYHFGSKEKLSRSAPVRTCRWRRPRRRAQTLGPWHGSVRRPPTGEAGEGPSIGQRLRDTCRLKPVAACSSVSPLAGGLNRNGAILRARRPRLQAVHAVQIGNRVALRWSRVDGAGGRARSGSFDRILIFL